MFKKEVSERFLRYAVIDTMSIDDIADKVHPSFKGEWDLLRMLEKELREMGIKDVSLDEHGYLLARIPANVPGLPCIAFSAHVDTADDVPGNGVKPRLVEKYDGGDIRLNEDYAIYANENPELADYVGSSLIVSDGTTLLGGDDKAGVAEIMTAIHYLIENPSIEHGEIEVLFSPDEETGCGMDFFEPKVLHSEALYTVDGGTRYEIEAECFNAATCYLTFSGVSYHLGSARGRMVNAVKVASAFVDALPQAESPEATDERFGYYCPHQLKASVSEAWLELVLRDFDLDNLKRRIEVVEQMAGSFEMMYPGSKIEVNTKWNYLNMIEAANKKPKAMEAIYSAGKVLGQPLITRVIRGGTDGARIAECGIPCPNLYTGAHNMHSRYEWLAVDAMNDSVKLLCEIVRQWTIK